MGDVLEMFEGLRYFFFVSDNEGWGYGSGIWHTTDGAHTWTQVVGDDKLKGVLSSAVFLDAKHGWIIGRARQIWRTTDGISWHLATKIPPAQGPPEEITKQLADDFNSITFISAERGWIAADDHTILSSKDGGESWQSISRLPNSLTAVRFLTENNGWALDNNGGLMHSLDGGRTWTVQPLTSNLSMKESRR